MIEFTIVKYLSDNLDIPVYAEEPEKATTQYVIVGNNGTSKSNYVYNSLISLQIYAGSMAEAVSLASDVCEVMEGIIELNEVSSCKLNSRYPYNDPTTHRYRYQAVYDVCHY